MKIVRMTMLSLLLLMIALPLYAQEDDLLTIAVRIYRGVSL